MLATYSSTAADARKVGRWSYWRFCAREAVGLLLAPVPARPPSLVHGLAVCALAGLGAACAYWYASGPEFPSTATLRFHDGVVAERLVPAALTDGDMHRILEGAVTVALSREALVETVGKFDRFGPERRRWQVEDIVERVRKNVRIDRAGNTVSVTFRHRDRYLAQIVCRDFVMRIMDESLRRQRFNVGQAVTFLSEQLENAGAHLDEVTRKTLVPPVAARHRLDLGMARKHYESMSERLLEARLALELIERRHGPSVELVDPPSLAQDPLFPPEVRTLGFGLAAGLLFGLLRYAWLAARWQSPPLGELGPRTT
ncbi:MAG: hypothetical protein R2729_24490 [Bryobacteraceae bacterium]